MSIMLVMPSNYLILCHPLHLLPAIFPSIRVFSNESVLSSGGQSIGVSASASVFQWIFRTDFLWDWLVGSPCRALKSLLQQSINSPKHQFSKASILWRSAFFMVQLSHPYMTTGKTIALTRRTLVGKVMSLFFNLLSSLVIAFLPRSKHLLISWLQSPSAVIRGPKKIKSVTVSNVSPSICQEVMGPEFLPQ